MPGYRFTPGAAVRLREILVWSIERFGVDRAERYKTDVLGRCEAIAAGHAQVRDGSRIADHPDADMLGFVRAGEHYIVFLEEPDGIVVIDLLHVRMNVAARIDALLSRRR